MNDANINTDQIGTEQQVNALHDESGDNSNFFETATENHTTEFLGSEDPVNIYLSHDFETNNS